MTSIPSTADEREAPGSWAALYAMAAGFFMIMIDTTIVSVSIPSIMTSLGADVTQVIWVSSAYLLTYAIPLLITGRLGDRYGPRRIYLIGLAVFTLSSLWCGFSSSITSLIAARAVQGLGAALMSPQTMAVIARLFPPRRRGGPMGLWGATASVAGLAGPLLGGVLVDSVGWEWIFFVNVPIGIGAMAAVWKYVPKFDTHDHSFDWAGVALSAIGLTLIVFGIQEGQAKGWPGWIIAMIVAGIVVMVGFVYQQSKNTGEPLMPLALFKSRNFAAANVGTFIMGAVVVAMSFPMMLYLQTARGLSPTRAALVSLPSAVLSFVLAPIVGKAANTRSTRSFAVTGFVLYAGVLFAQAEMMRPGVPVAWLLLPAAVMGVSAACIWGPLSMSATRDLPPKWAGAGSGVYNATRQLGSVLGSAAIAAIIEWQTTKHMPAGHTQKAAEGVHHALPGFLEEPFSVAMRHSSLFPAILTLGGIVASAFLVKPAFMKADEAAQAKVDGDAAGAPASAPVATSAVTADATGTPRPLSGAEVSQALDELATADQPVVARRAIDEVRPRRALPEA